MSPVRCAAVIAKPKRTAAVISRLPICVWCEKSKGTKVHTESGIFDDQWELLGTIRGVYHPDCISAAKAQAKVQLMQ